MFQKSNDARHVAQSGSAMVITYSSGLSLVADFDPRKLHDRYSLYGKKGLIFCLRFRKIGVMDWGSYAK